MNSVDNQVQGLLYGVIRIVFSYECQFPANPDVFNLMIISNERIMAGSVVSYLIRKCKD